MQEHKTKEGEFNPYYTAIISSFNNLLARIQNGSFSESPVRIYEGLEKYLTIFVKPLTVSLNFSAQYIQLSSDRYPHETEIWSIMIGNDDRIYVDFVEKPPVITTITDHPEIVDNLCAFFDAHSIAEERVRGSLFDRLFYHWVITGQNDYLGDSFDALCTSLFGINDVNDLVSNLQ